MSQSQKGFTMLELIVMIGILGVIAVSSISIFLRSTVSTTKNASLRQVKQSGDYAITQFENDLRGAGKIVENGSSQVCESDMNEIAFNTTDGITHTWSFDASTNPTNGIYFDGQNILNGEVLLAAFNLDCSHGIETYTSFVNLAFTLQKGTPGMSTNQELAQVEFSTKVTLRN